MQGCLSFIMFVIGLALMCNHSTGTFGMIIGVVLALIGYFSVPLQHE